MGFASFPEFQIKNELLKIAYLIALNKCHHLKTGCLMIVLRPIMYRYKDADIDILYTYTRIITFMYVVPPLPMIRTGSLYMMPTVNYRRPYRMQMVPDWAV